MTTRPIIVAIAASVALSAVAPLAQAEPTKKDDHYGYEFGDELLEAETRGAHTALIRVVKVARRDRLLRPRVHFVTEMLKSVENM